MKKQGNIAISDIINNRRKLISTKELCQMLAPFYSANTVRCYLQLGKFPFESVKIGHRTYVSKVKAENYLAKKLEELDNAEALAETNK